MSNRRILPSRLLIESISAFSCTPVDAARRSSRIKSTSKGSLRVFCRSGSGRCSSGISNRQQSKQYIDREAPHRSHWVRAANVEDGDTQLAGWSLTCWLHFSRKHANASVAHLVSICSVFLSTQSKVAWCYECTVPIAVSIPTVVHTVLRQRSSITYSSRSRVRRITVLGSTYCIDRQARS